MATSKTIRKNKRFLNEEKVNIIKSYKVHNQPAPTQDRIRQFILDHPNCVISDIYKGLPDIDGAYIRKIIRMMVEGHRVIQKFSIP